MWSFPARHGCRGSLEGLDLDIVFSAACWTLVATLLLRGKRLAGATVFILGSAWLLYSPSILTWVEHLGTDSFSEAQNFDFVEAINFLESLKPILRRQSLRVTGATLAAGLLLAAAIRGVVVLLARGRGAATARHFAAGAGVMIAVLVSIQLFPAVGAFRSNSEIYRTIHDNFHLDSRAVVIRSGPERELKVVVYIGESISALNMGVYGYPRPTTPELQAFRAENQDVFLFHEVFSPHVHTAPSLLEALSVGLDRADDFMPIGDRKRVSVIDLLNQAGIPSSLISNQGSSGTWNNLASTVVFRNVTRKEFSFNSILLGELEHKAKRPLDHEFLLTALDEHGGLLRGGREVVFLHSYAGHGPYLRHIDERFKKPVDDFLTGRPVTSIIGSGIADPEKVVRTVEDYDSTVRYADFCVASVLHRVKASPFPVVFVYFSDHGDAVYAGRLHDSARFLHEMARVPFYVYFNEAAAQVYPDLVSRFRIASRERRPSTLAQFPASLLSLFGLEVDGGLYKGIGQDELEVLPPILTRETGAGYSYVRIGTRGSPTAGPRDATDPHTALLRAAWRLQRAPTRLCQYGSDTIGKALRGAMVSDCLWLASGRDRSIPVRDPSRGVPAGLDLETATSIARGYGRSFWIADRQLHTAAGCRTLDGLLEANALDGPLDALVMFPSNTPWHDPEIRNCIDSLQSRGYRTAFEVHLGIAGLCADELTEGGGLHCARLSQLLLEVAESGAFTDLGFDYSATAVIEQLAIGTQIGWNAWNVGLDQVDPDSLSRFRMVAVNIGEDPNDR